MAAIKMTDNMRSGRISAALAKRWYVVLLTAILGAALAFSASTFVTPVYSSSTSLFFSLRTGGTATDVNQASAYTQNQMLSYAQLATSSIVLDKVIADIGPQVNKAQLRSNINVSAPQNTVILDIKVNTTDAKLSARIANSVAQNLESAVSAMSPSESTNKATVVANVIEPAVPAIFQSSPSKKKNALLGAIFGTGFSFLAIIFSVVADTKVRSVEVLKSMTNLPLLGTVDRNRKSPDTRPVAVRAPNSAATERFRHILAGLRFASASHSMTAIAITSAIPSEGKTLASLNMALVMAETKTRILLIDADLRRPQVGSYIGFDSTVGLTTVLVGDTTLDVAVQRFGNSTLDILTAGAIPPNPAELLGSARMQNIVNAARKNYDFVIIDTAPVLSVADVSVIAQLLDSVVVVVDSTKLRKAQLEQATETLEMAGTHISGIILNKVKRPRVRDVYDQEHTGGAPKGLTKPRAASQADIPASEFSSSRVGKL